MMETSTVRQRVMQTIERAKRTAVDKRARADEAARAYEPFLQQVAVPLVRQLATALKASGYAFSVFTPSGAIRLMSDKSTEDFIELTLETSGDQPYVLGHTSRARGRRVVQSERPVATGDISAITEEQLLEFMLKELEPFVER
jgi:hypothetical protein